VQELNGGTNKEVNQSKGCSMGQVSNKGFLKQQLEAQNINIDLGEAPSRNLGQVGGKLGGEMTRRLVEMAQQQLINKK